MTQSCSSRHLSTVWPVFSGPPKCVTKEMRQVAVVTWLLALAAPSTGRLVPGCREVELQLAQECRQEQARPRVA